MSVVEENELVIKSKRLQALPPYLFAELDKAKRAAKAAGKDVIDLGVGDPDLPTPPHIIAKMNEAAQDVENHRYSMSSGMPILKEAIARWYQNRFGVTLDPATEILPLIGSKEGIAWLPMAITNPGDVVLVPDPGYPPYTGGAILAGCEPVPMPLLEENGFFPDLGDLSQQIAKRARILYLNYPNNPTAALASDEQFDEAIALARDYNITVAHDAAYTEIAYDGIKPQSFLQRPGAKEVGVEFHSVSKTYNMTGWRVGWVCGNAEVVAAMSQMKSNLDSGIFQPLQYAAIEALEGDQGPMQETIAVYQKRRDLLVEGLNKVGWKVTKPAASLYIWTKVPTKESSMQFCQRVLEKTGVVVTPGNGFGESGEGYFRMSLTLPTERIEEAITRLQQSL